MYILTQSALSIFFAERVLLRAKQVSCTLSRFPCLKGNCENVHHGWSSTIDVLTQGLNTNLRLGNYHHSDGDDISTHFKDLKQINKEPYQLDAVASSDTNFGLILL